MGSLDGLFIVNEEDWSLLQEKMAENTDVYFGEMLGKHSEVTGTLSSQTITVVSEDQDFCVKFDELRAASGVCPLDYLDEDENDSEGDEDWEDEDEENWEEEEGWEDEVEED